MTAEESSKDSEVKADFQTQQKAGAAQAEQPEPMNAEPVKMITVGNKKFKIKDTVTLCEIVIHKLENGGEVQQFIAHEFMMTDHKEYMIRNLCKAIETVTAAKKRQGTAGLIGKALINKTKRLANRLKGAFGGKKK